MDIKAIWLYDGVCLLCDGGVRFTLAHEKAHEIKFITIQSAHGRALALHHGIDPDNPQSFMFIDQDIPYFKSDGVLALLAYLNAPWSWLRIFRFVPRPFRDFIYGLIARHRYRLFGRKNQCSLPNEAEQDRFII